jgi:polyisoprenoid-binding protein YceI
VWVDARSSLHPINTETRGLEGWVEVSPRPDGTLDLTVPVKGKLHLSTDRLSSGNQLYDRELKRRIDARRYPLIEGEIVRVTESGDGSGYLVAGDLSFHGKTRRFEHRMTITVREGSAIELKGDYVFDIREFNMKPPSMLMLKVYPEVAVRVELYGTTEP